MTAKVAIDEPYRIVLFLKGTGKSALPLRPRLRAEKKKASWSGSAEAGSPSEGIGATPRDSELAASNLLVVRVDANCCRRQIRITGHISIDAGPAGGTILRFPEVSKRGRSAAGRT